MNIFIDELILNLEASNCNNVICLVKELYKKGIKILTNLENIPYVMRKVYQSEGINLIDGETADYKIILSAEKKYTLLNNYYETLEDALKSINEFNRIAEVTRNTKETKIYVKVNLDGSGKSDINTGIGFFDHMLNQIARHGNIDLTINAKGDLEVDNHHTVEDTGLALGETILKALGNKIGIKRYGFLLPMDDSIAKVAIDLGGRAYLNFKCKFKNSVVGKFPTELTEEFFKSLAAGLQANIYIKCKGKNDHHKIESIFKAFAKALNEALRFDERAANILPTTKGVL